MTATVPQSAGSAAGVQADAATAADRAAAINPFTTNRAHAPNGHRHAENRATSIRSTAGESHTTIPAGARGNRTDRDSGSDGSTTEV